MSLEMFPLSRDQTLDNLQTSYQSLVIRQSVIKNTKPPSFAEIWRRRLVPNFSSTVADLNFDTCSFLWDSIALLKTTAPDKKVLDGFQRLAKLLDAQYAKSLKLQWWERGREKKQGKKMEVLVRAVGEQISCLPLLLELDDFGHAHVYGDARIERAPVNAEEVVALLDDVTSSRSASSALNLLDVQDDYEVLILKHCKLAKGKRSRLGSWRRRKNFCSDLVRDQFAACSFVWDTVKVVKDTCDLQHTGIKKILGDFEDVAHRLDAHYKRGIEIKWWQTGYEQKHQLKMVELLAEFGFLISALTVTLQVLAGMSKDDTSTAIVKNGRTPNLQVRSNLQVGFVWESAMVNARLGSRKHKPGIINVVVASYILI